MPKREHILKGKQIILRKLRHSDAKSIHNHARHKDIARFTELPHPYRLKHAKDFIKEAKKTTDSHSFGIELKDEKGIIGIITLSKIDYKHKKARVGFWLSKEHHGRGIMSEALFLILDFAFNKLRLNRVSCSVFEENLASNNLVQKFGVVKEGTEREEEFRFGKYHHTIMYGLLRREWLAKSGELAR